MHHICLKLCLHMVLYIGTIPAQNNFNQNNSWLISFSLPSLPPLFFCSFVSRLFTSGKFVQRKGKRKFQKIHFYSLPHKCHKLKIIPVSLSLRHGKNSFKQWQDALWIGDKGCIFPPQIPKKPIKAGSLLLDSIDAKMGWLLKNLFPPFV